MLLDRRFEDVKPIRITRQLFRRVQLHGNNSYYRFLLNVCELIHHNLLPDEASGALRFEDFRKDRPQMWRLFERFVERFYVREQRVFSVRAQHALSWDAAQLDERANALLPGMNIDVLLESRDRVIVIDTKFYHEALQTGPYRQTFRSENLYQLFAYLKNLEHRGGAFARCEGMLLYPTVEHEIESRFELQGHPVRIRTIDLGRDWREIHEAMLGLIGAAPKIAAGGPAHAAFR